MPGEEKVSVPTMIQERMIAILAELPAIGKDSRNEQQKFMYRSHDAVLNALNPLLAKHGVFVTSEVLDRVTDRRETRSGSVMYEVNLHVRFTFWGAGGDSVAASAWGEGTDSGDKSTNKAMTMAFKNVLAVAFAVSTADTIDSDSTSPEETVKEFDVETDLTPGAISGKDAAKRIVTALNEMEPTVEWPDVIGQAVKAKYGVEKRTDLKGPDQADFWRRLSNSLYWMQQVGPAPGEFPLITAEQIVAGIAYGFSGAVVEVTYNPVAKDAAEVPFGEEEAK